MHTCTHAHMHTRIHAYTHTCMHICMYTCLKGYQPQAAGMNDTKSTPEVHGRFRYTGLRLWGLQLDAKSCTRGDISERNSGPPPRKLASEDLHMGTLSLESARGRLASEGSPAASTPGARRGQRSGI